jgi:arylsulfatase A-like enzyme
MLRLKAPLLMVALTVAGGLGSAAGQDRPSIVLITVDTLRADRLSGLGYERPTSPHIDALLATGAVFTEARTVEPLTSPALCSLLTSLEPHHHGSTRNGLKMRTDLDSLGKILGRSGWTTAAFTRKRWLGLLNSEATAEDVTDSALKWLHGHRSRSPDDPFLLWVHYVEPHAPYRFHAEYASRLGIARHSSSPSDHYDTEIAAADHAIGSLLKGLGDRSPIIVFAADHGESLGDHGYWGHGRHLYEPSLKIPMAISWPGRITPKRVEGQALITDITPTLLDLVGLAVPDSFAGASWASTLTRDTPASVRRGACFQAHRGAVQVKHDSNRARSLGLLAVGYVEGNRKEILRIRSKEHLVFDLAADPEEKNNLVDSQSEATDDLLRCVGETVEGLEQVDRMTPTALDNESREKLRALGYLE